jgi:opacity protein-like surface antigen
MSIAPADAMLKSSLIAAAMVITLLPAPASADWLLTPNIGTTFGADTHGQGHTTLGAAIAWVDEEAFAWELDFNFAPDFFEGEHEGFTFTGDSHVGTLMANALVGLLPGDAGLRAFHPYVAAGLGVMQMRAVTVGAEDGLFDSLVHEVGWNVGAGAFGLIGDRLGVRGDVRYMRSFQNQVPSWTRGIDVDVAPGNFDFWRAGVGVTFRWGSE